MTDRLDTAEWVIDAVGPGADAEVTISGGTSALTRFANSFIHQNVAEEGDVLTLRLAIDQRVLSATTTRLDRDALRRFIDDARSATLLQPADPEWPGLSQPSDAPDVDQYDADTAEAHPSRRAEIVKAFVDAGEGASAAGYCETSGTETVFANSAGVRRQGRASHAVIDGIQQHPGAAGSGHAASVRIGDLDGDAVGALASRRAVASIDPINLAPGAYPVVLAPECVASIAVFLGFYGFNAKAHQEGQSFVELGADQFDAAITLTDDVTHPDALGIGFDTEGSPRRVLEMVRHGVTAGLAHDRRTAARAGTESTGHAGPGSDVYGPAPSMIFLGGGDTPQDEMIRSVERGLYVATLNYCRVLDPKTMVVTGLTRNGTFLIENGEIVGAVGAMRFTQSFVEALSPGAVLAVGDDARLADSEFGPGLAHAPSLHLASWNITGGASG